VDTYQCPVCGGTVTQDEGCRRCGRPYDQDIAALAMFKRTVASLEAKKRKNEKDQVLLRTQIAHASAQRDSLARRVREKLEQEVPGRGPGRSLRALITRRGGEEHQPALDPGTTAPPQGPAAPALEGPEGTGAVVTRTATVPPAAVPQANPPRAGAPATRAARTAPPGARPAERAPAGRPGERPPGRPGAHPGGLPPAIAARLPGMLTESTPAGAPQVRIPKRPRRPIAGPGRVGGAETTTFTSQSVLLAVGGLLLAGAAVVLAVFGFGSLDSFGRVALLSIATLILLMLPVRLAQRGLTATAETVASVGLLMVLLDGYVTWSLDLFFAPYVSTSVYFGIVCLATAVIATAYRGASHLIAPRYATVLVLQPVLPLLTYAWIKGSPAGWSLVLSGVAAIDLALGISLTRPGRFAKFAGLARPVYLHGDHSGRPDDGRPDEDGAPADDGTPPPPPMRPESAPEEPEDVKTVAGFGVEPQPAEQPEPHSLEAPEILRDLTWVLFTIAFGASVSYASVALATTTTLTPTVRAAMALLLAASLGVAGSLAWRRAPLPDLAGGLATIAVIAAVTRVGMTGLPGRGLVFAAVAVAIASTMVATMPEPARFGPRIATGIAAAATAVVLLAKAVPAISEPVRAAYPWWNVARLTGYADRIGAAAGPASWQLVVAGALLTLAAALALPGWVRADATLAGGVITLLTLPAAMHFNWVLTPSVLVLAAIGVGACGLAPREERIVNGVLIAAGVLGGYAFLTSLTRPAMTALTLAAITLGGYAIAMLRPARTDPAAELMGQRVGDWAAGAAAAALPGAVCAGLAALVTEEVFPRADSSAVLAGGFVAVSATLGYSAYRLITGRRRSAPLLLGTAAGALGVALASLLANRTTLIDIAVGMLLLTSAGLLWLAPSLGPRNIFGQDLQGNDIAAAAATASATAALARVLALGVPGIGLVTTAVIVLTVATAVRGLPSEQRRGPVTGELLIGAVIAAASGAAAITAAIGVIRAANPLWHADLGPAWGHTAGQYVPYGWQAPIALLLVAAAAVIVVDRPLGDDIAAVAIGLAVVGAPVAFGLTWWAPMAVGLLAAIGMGVAAALADLPRVAYTRLAVAGLLALFTAGASLVRPASTAATLISLSLSAALIAMLAGVRLAAARTSVARAARAHLVPVGGGASAVAVLAFAGAAAALSAGAHQPAPVTLGSALAATSLALALAGLACWRAPMFLPYVSAGVAIAGSVIALAALPNGLSIGLYAATAALLGVLAELLRVNAVRRVGWRPEDGWQPVGDWSPARGERLGGRWIPGVGWLASGRWRPASPSSFGAGAAAASAIPAAIAVATVALPLVAALFGPYHFAVHPWTSTATGAADLSPFNGWAAHSTDVITAAALTFAGALAAVGLGGSRQLIANRLVAVVVPGAGLTLLLAPAALDARQLQAAFALLVTTLCGLSLALTTPPAPDSIEGGSLRVARRLVFFLAVLAAVAGQLGSLATRSMTIEALAGSVVVGAIGALWGRYPLARMIGWHVAVGAAQLLAIAASLAAGHPAYWAAFPLLAACAVAIAVAAVLPRVRPTVSIENEIMVIEATGMLGMAGAVALTIGNPRYTALLCTALGAVLGLAASRPGRPTRYLQGLILAAAASEVIGIALLVREGNVAVPEAYSLPFAVFALLVGIVELNRRPDMGSWLAYGPALVAGFLPSLALVLMSETAPARRVLVIVAGVLTVALGSVRRQKAPVVVGSVVTAVATLQELLRLSAMLPWWVLLILFTAAGVLLVGLGATYEQRRHNMARLKGALNRLR
jgi:hypothetical protein